MSTRTGTRLHVGVELWSLLQRDEPGENLPRDTIDTLLEARVLVDSTSDELAEVVAENRGRQSNS